MEKLLSLCEEIGFSHWGELNMTALRFRQEVRDMCAADRCRSYGKCWTCPPHCGTLEDSAARAAAYRRGVLVQTTGVLEDDFDIEGMMAAEAAHRARFRDFVRRVREAYPHCFPMGAGACTICDACTCPEAPCRFPELAISSMEACGLVVSDVCRDSGLGYYYGPRTITYTACVLI